MGHKRKQWSRDSSSLPQNRQTDDDKAIPRSLRLSFVGSRFNETRQAQTFIFLGTHEFHLKLRLESSMASNFEHGFYGSLKDRNAVMLKSYFEYF